MKFFFFFSSLAGLLSVAYGSIIKNSIYEAWEHVGRMDVTAAINNNDLSLMSDAAPVVAETNTLADFIDDAASVQALNDADVFVPTTVSNFVPPRIIFNGLDNFAHIYQLPGRQTVCVSEDQLLKMAFTGRCENIEFALELPYSYFDMMYQERHFAVLEEAIRRIKAKFLAKTFSPLRLCIGAIVNPGLVQVFLRHDIVCLNPARWLPSRAEDPLCPHLFVDNLVEHFNEFAAFTYGYQPPVHNAFQSNEICESNETR